MDSAAFWGVLKSRGLNFFAGVPDSTFGEAYNFMVRDPDIRYVPAVREDVALGVASAAYFAGGLGGVIMQNSGIGNIVNPLTSFSLMYKIPVLLVVGWRGYGGPPNDAPEHWIMGVKTPEIIDLLEVRRRQRRTRICSLLCAGCMRTPLSTTSMRIVFT